MKPVSKTAYYCCGVRMQDAASAKPLIGDNYAKLLLGKEGMDYWSEFKDLRYPNASNAVRHFLIDNYVKEALLTQPGSTVVLIGAGLDSRAFRQMDRDR
ncbi:MAG TPA: class I SAM-dependent methyltransferase [Chitinophagaceae bacterium]|jgi:O-methyltransferase involved in polyketide biosynthesis